MDNISRKGHLAGKSSGVEISLALLKANEGGVILRLETPELVTRRLLELGLAPGEFVKLIRGAPPFGDPIEIELLNYRLAIRKDEAKKIFLLFQPAGQL